MKYKALVVGLFILSCSSISRAYEFLKAVPTSVRLIDNGLLVTGDFDMTGVSCHTGPNAIFLPGTHPQFDQKLSLALTAYAMGKKIEVLIPDPVSTSCLAVSAIGTPPVVASYIWSLK